MTKNYQLRDLRSMCAHVDLVMERKRRLHGCELLKNLLGIAESNSQFCELLIDYFYDGDSTACMAFLDKSRPLVDRKKAAYRLKGMKQIDKTRRALFLAC